MKSERTARLPWLHAAPAGAPMDAYFSLQTGGGMAQATRREGAIGPGYRDSDQLHSGHLQHPCSACHWIDQILRLPIDEVEGGDVIPPDTIVRIRSEEHTSELQSRQY